MEAPTIKTYVLYHANCTDGFCAAWVASTALKGNVEFVPVTYGQEPPVIEPRSWLYILDFSYSREQLCKWWTPSKTSVDRLIVLDHHKTAQVALQDFDVECVANGMGTPTIRFDMNKSGGRLAWDHFNGHTVLPAPWLVDYTEDRDLWRFKLHRSLEISAFLRSHPFDFKTWDSFSAYNPGSNRWESWADEGAAILRYQKEIVDLAVRNAAEVELDGHKILCVNSTVLFSEIAGELAKGRAFGAAWFIRSDGKKQWSLRSTESGIDVAELAKRHGGGGHRNAAGFEEDAHVCLSGKVAS